jgi:hypothetical protein
MWRIAGRAVRCRTAAAGLSRLAGTHKILPVTGVMRAVVAERPGPPDVLAVRDVPVPEPGPGWTLVQVKAAGLNRSEIMTRLGFSPDVTFPRILGIECGLGEPGAAGRYHRAEDPLQGLAARGDALPGVIWASGAAPFLSAAGWRGWPAGVAATGRRSWTAAGSWPSSAVRSSSDGPWRRSPSTRRTPRRGRPW